MIKNNFNKQDKCGSRSGSVSRSWSRSWSCSRSRSGSGFWFKSYSLSETDSI